MAMETTAEANRTSHVCRLVWIEVRICAVDI